MRRADLLDRTVAAVASRARWVLLTDDVPDRRGFLQAVAPVVKLPGCLALVAVTVTRQETATVAAIAGVVAALTSPPGSPRGRSSAGSSDRRRSRWSSSPPRRS